MSELFRVAIHYGKDCGYIEYDPDTKEATVVLGNTVKKKAVEAFLHSEHLFREAQRSLRDFKEIATNPTESLGSLKLALTQLWLHTDVLVDWSRPVVIR